MKTFLIKLACFLALQVAILTPLVFIGNHFKTSQHYLCSMADKLELLKTAPGPRIIFVGGSNLAFGLNSKLVAEKTEYNPVNLGVHVSFGINPLMRMVEEHAQAGDLIVLSPEYGLFGKDEMKCKEKFASQLYDLWPDCRQYFQPDLECPLPETTSPPLFRLADRVAHGRRLLFDSPDQRRYEIYERGSFNEFGDHVNHYGVARESVQHHMGTVYLDLHSDLDKRYFIENIEAINRFCDHCNALGANVVYTHAPLSAARCVANRKAKEMFESTLASNMKCPIITSLDQLTFEDKLFFDTEYHLTEAGANKRTAIFCRQLLRHQARHVARASPKTSAF